VIGRPDGGVDPRAAGKLVETQGSAYGNIKTFHEADHGYCVVDISNILPFCINAFAFVTEDDCEGLIDGDFVHCHCVLAGDSSGYPKALVVEVLGAALNIAKFSNPHPTLDAAGDIRASELFLQIDDVNMKNAKGFR
jgi:hypothetical protein